MPDSPTLLNNLYQSFYNETPDSRITLSNFIKRLNLLLFRMNITKPAEQSTKFYYVKDFEKYKLPTSGFREAIALYSPTAKIMRYVSLFRFNLGDPRCAYTDQSSGGTRFLRVRNPVTESIVSTITEGDDLTADGAWSISGGSNLAIDTYNKKSGAGSLSFNITTTQAILTFIKTTAINATNYTEFLRSRFYAWLPTSPTTIKIRVGNDASNYFEHSITVQASGEAFTNGDWNENEFAQESATETGTVDKSALDWFQIELNFSSTPSTGKFRIDKLVLAKPEIMDFEWYTHFVGINSSGVLIQKITESDSSTDEPIIKDYADYINTALDGLVFEELKVKDPGRAEIFGKRYQGEMAPDGRTPVNGLAFLRMRYPNRRASYKRMKTLPDLDYSNQRSNRLYAD